MRRRLILLFMGVFVLQGACLVAQEEGARRFQERIITISDYSAFLEAVASTSQEELFSSFPREVVAINDLGDQKMVNALEASAVLMRSGKPGNYRYQVVTSDSDDPAPFLSWDDAVCYGAWKKTSQSKTDEVWGIEVKHGTAAMDHALRSNVLIFQIVSDKASAHEAAGEEVMSGVLDQMLEAILDISAVASAVPREGSVPLRVGERPEDLVALLSPQPTLDLTIPEDAEQREMSKIFTQALSGKAPNYYAESDAMIPELERAWEARAVGRQHLQAKEEALDQAHAKFKEEEELLASKNIEKTALGRIANAAGKASSITSAVSVPIVSLSGVFEGASTLADIANRRIEKRSFKQARAALEKATKEETEARKRFDQLEETAFVLDVTREQREEEVSKAQQEEALQEARRLKPPLQGSKEHEWQQWAEELMKETGASHSEVIAFAQKAKAHPNWAAQRAAQTWVERMNQRVQHVSMLEEKQKIALDLRETSYALAQERAQEARDTATAACERHERMIQEEADTHEEYDTLRELLRQLEAQKQKTAMPQQSIEQAKNETREACKVWQRAKRELDGNSLANEMFIKDTKENALQLEAEALKLFQQKEALQKKGAREINRIKTQLLANQHAWREVWPEEVLYQKLQQQRGETVFAAALKSKSQGAWGEAEQEAKELGSLWKRMKNQPYQELWKECAKRAALKKAFLGIQEQWASFSDAVQAFVENPNFDPDFKNSQHLATRGEEITHAIEQVLPLIEGTLLPTMGIGTNALMRAVRNVVHVAKKKANSPKPLGESTWKDVVEETSLKSLKAAGAAPHLWQEEISWMAQAVQEAGTFAKTIAEPSQGLNKSGYINPAEFQKLEKALLRTEETMNQIKKAMYQKQIRYMRARRNFVGRSLEPQKMALLEKKKSFYKKERRWKGERGLLEVRKKLSPQWKKRLNKASFVQDFHGQESIPVAPVRLDETSEEASITSEATISHETKLEENHVDPFQDIPTLESRLAKERVVLDREKEVIDQKEKELQERTATLETEAKVLDQKAATLATETARIAEEKAKLEQKRLTQEKEKEEVTEELAKKRAALQMEEARLLQEREALAKEAESLEALASAKVDQKTWGLLFGKLQQLIEQDKDAVFNAHAPEGIDAFMSWLEAHHQTKAQEEAISSDQQTIEKATDLTEITEINFQIEELKRLASESKTKAKASLDNEQWGYQQSSDCLNEAIDYLSNAITAISSSNAKNAIFWKEAALQAKKAAEKYQGAAETWLQKDENRARHLDAVAATFLVQARNKKYLAKVSEAEAIGRLELAKQWHNVAEQNQQASEYLKRSVEAYIAGKGWLEALSWKNAGHGFYNAAEKLAKGIEADDAKKPAIAQAWQETAAVQQQSGKFYKKAAEACLTGKGEEDEETASWFNAGSYFSDAVAALRKGIEAEEAGKPVVAQALREIAVLRQKSGEFSKKAAEAYAVGKEEEAISWKNANNGFSNAEESLKMVIAVEEIRKKLEKMIAVEEVRNSTVAQVWCEAVALQKQSADFYKKAAGTYAAGKEEEGQSWLGAGLGFYYAAEKLGKALEAEEAGKPAIAKVWREIATLYQQSVEFYKKAAEVYAAGKRMDAVSWFNAGLHFCWAAEKLEKGIEAEEAGKSEVVQAWREVAMLHQQSAEFYKKDTEAYAAGKKNENQNWGRAGEGFYNAAKKLEKGIEAEEAGKSEVVQAWREVAILHQQSAEFYKKDAETYAAEKGVKTFYWKDAGNSFYRAAENLENAIKAEEAGKLIVAQAWREIAVLYQKAGDFSKKAAEACVAGKEQEAGYWNSSGRGFYFTAERLEQGIEPEEAEKPMIAEALRDAALLQQQSVEFFKKTLETLAAGKEKGAGSWASLGNGFDRAAGGLRQAFEAKRLREALEAEEAGKPTIAQAWREAATLQQQSSEFYKKAVEAYAAGKEKEAISWQNAGEGCYNAAEELGRGIGAEEEGYPEVAEARREAAEKYKEAHLCWKRTAEAIAAGRWFTYEGRAKAATAAAEEASEKALRLGFEKLSREH